MFEFCHRRADDLCAECQFVVVACGSQEAAFKFCNDEEQSGFFDLAVVSTGRSKEFGTTHFKIRKVVGMVQVAHWICFDIADSDINFVLF